MIIKEYEKNLTFLSGTRYPVTKYLIDYNKRISKLELSYISITRFFAIRKLIFDHYQKLKRTIHNIHFNQNTFDKLLKNYYFGLYFRWEHLVYQFSGHDHVIDAVIKRGKVVYEKKNTMQ